MAFLNPLLLFGIAAISVPIIIHLLTNRKVKRVVWAAMQFLQNAVEKNQRRLNIEDLILLALRCLLLLLLAFALARPAFRKGGFGGFSKGQEMAVIAIDNSYSMSQTDGVTSRFDKAKKAAEQIIDAMPMGSSVAVFLFSDVVRAAIPEPTLDRNLARKIIREAPLSDRTTDVQIALSQALGTLGRHAALRKQVYLITDAQANGMNPGEIHKLLDAAKSEVKTQFVIVGGREDHNLGVSDLRLGSALAPAHQSLRFETEVTNYGVDEARNVQVGLSTDGDPPSDEATIEAIPSGASKRVSLFTKFREPGDHSVTARIPQDHVPADDQRTIAVRALKEISVLLVDGDPGAEPRASEVFYLRNALTPVEPEELDKYFIKTKTVSPAELESASLGDFEAVVLADVADFSDPTLVAFETYLRRGGGLIVFPGPKINRTFYNDKLQKQHGFLPAILGEPHGNAGQQTAAFHLQDKNYGHSIVSIWKDPASGTLATANFYRAFELKPDKGGGGGESGAPAVVVNCADGAPAIVEHTWGLGRVILFNSTANMKWNDLPAHPAYVPLVLRALGSILNRQNERLNIAAGAKFQFVCDPELVGKEANIVKPDGKKDAGGLRRITVVNGLPMLQFDETDTAGAYSVEFKDNPSASVKFAVQSDPRESKLEELPQAQLDALSPPAQVIRWTPEVNLGNAIEKGRTGTEFWVLLTLLALAVAATETVVADIFSKSR